MGFPQPDEHPVVNVSWNDAVAFCQWLSRSEGKTYRLPTEAEWEYACRAGTTSRYYIGDEPEKLAEVGNTEDAAYLRIFGSPPWAILADDGYAFTAPVGRFRPNAFGLYDMHGNASQWCSDWWGYDYYQSCPLDDPPGPAKSDSRVHRGGGWHGGPCECRSASREAAPPYQPFFDVGFRVARNP